MAKQLWLALPRLGSGLAWPGRAVEVGGGSPWRGRPTVCYGYLMPSWGGNGRARLGLPIEVTILEGEVKFVPWQRNPSFLTHPAPSFRWTGGLLRPRVDRIQEVWRPSHIFPKLGPAQEAMGSCPSSPTSTPLSPSFHISLGPLGCFQEGGASLYNTAWKAEKGERWLDMDFCGRR